MPQMPRQTAMGRMPTARASGSKGTARMFNDMDFAGTSPDFYNQAAMGAMMGYGANVGAGQMNPSVGGYGITAGEMDPSSSGNSRSTDPRVLAAEQRLRAASRAQSGYVGMSAALQNGGQIAYTGGSRNFDERTGQYNRPPGRPMRGPDQMGMPQAYPDRIEDPMRNRGRGRDRERGQLTRLSPGVYRNAQGTLVNSRGGRLPNQPRRDNMQDLQREVDRGFAGMQPPNGKGPEGTYGLDRGFGGGYNLPYDFGQGQNPMYQMPMNQFGLQPQPQNYMPYMQPQMPQNPIYRSPGGLPGGQGQTNIQPGYGFYGR